MGHSTLLITRTFNRILVNNPLCADQRYLDNTRCYVTSIYMMSAIIYVFLSWVKLLVGPILSIPYQFLYQRGKGYAMPLICSYLEEAKMEIAIYKNS